MQYGKNTEKDKIKLKRNDERVDERNEVTKKYTNNFNMKGGVGTKLQTSCYNNSISASLNSPFPSSPRPGILYSFSSTSAAECSRPCCAWLDFQTLREGSTELCLSCRQGTLVGYGRQLLALSLDGCRIRVRSSSWTCLKWPSCNVLCCFSFDLCLFMEGLTVMCALTGVHVCE